MFAMFRQLHAIQTFSMSTNKFHPKQFWRQNFPPKSIFQNFRALANQKSSLRLRRLTHVTLITLSFQLL